MAHRWPRLAALPLALLPAATPQGAAPRDPLREVSAFPSVAADKYPSLATDRQGRPWVAYVSMAGGSDRIVVRRRQAAGWSEPVTVATGEGIETHPHLVADPEGGLLLLWQGRRGGRWEIYERRHRSGRWQAERRITSSPGAALHPRAAVDTDGRIWLVHEEVDGGRLSVQLRVRLPGMEAPAWSDPVAVHPGGQDRRPVLAPRAEGGVWVAWDSTRSGNYDVYLSWARWLPRERRIELGPLLQVTAHASFDDTPWLASDLERGDLWIAWNSMRAHAGDRYRTDRHLSDAMVRCLRGGRWLAPPGVVAGALPGQVSFGAVDKTPTATVDPYWHWKQTQSYPRISVDAHGRLWVVWRTDATGAHNFDLWARVYDGGAWSEELRLTTPYPGRDEWPALVPGADGALWMAWEGQAQPEDREASLGRGDVDLFNTKDAPTNVFVGRLELATRGADVTAGADARWTPAPLAPVEPDSYEPEAVGEPPSPGPPPGTAATADRRYAVYFGDPHSHSVLSDAKVGWPDQILTLARDRYGLDFAVVSDHSEMGRLQAGEYAELQLVAAAFTEPGRFVSLTGFEWTAGTAYGHRVVLYEQTDGPQFAANDPASDTIEELYDHVHRHRGVMSPHHSGQARWGRWNPEHHDPRVERNFEIASWHGRFEFYGNPWEGRRQVPGHHYQDALRRGYRMGVMAASDTHHLVPGQGGLTAVLAERLDRPSLMEAVRQRRIYATTGEKIVLEFTANGAPMGSELADTAALELRIRVEGTAAIDRLEVVRDLVDTFAAVRLDQDPDRPGGVFYLYDPAAPAGGRYLEVEDTRRLALVFEDSLADEEVHSYYVRVTQANAAQAWSSPVWVTARPTMPPAPGGRP